jgi:hypothetical protein
MTRHADAPKTVPPIHTHDVARTADFADARRAF